MSLNSSGLTEVGVCDACLSKVPPPMLHPAGSNGFSHLCFTCVLESLAGRKVDLAWAAARRLKRHEP